MGSADTGDVSCEVGEAALGGGRITKSCCPEAPV